MLERICELLPNCGKAMELVEAGCERELSMAERLRLRYHGRLCPFCGCASGKFQSAMNRMRDAEQQRAPGTGR